MILLYQFPQGFLFQFVDSVYHCACVLGRKLAEKTPGKYPPFSKYVQTWLTHRIRTRRSNMDYSWSLLRFLKVILIVTSVYWCILLSILVFLLLGQCSTGDFDHSAGVQAGLVMIVFIIVLSVGGGALVILLVAFHVLSQQYFKGIDINFYLVQSLYYYAPISCMPHLPHLGQVGE